MKSMFCKFFILLAISLGTLTITAPASAAYRCVWVPAHTYQGYYYPGKRVCGNYYSNRYYYYNNVRYYGNRCAWRPAHWYRGYWYPAHRYCW